MIPEGECVATIYVIRRNSSYGAYIVGFDGGMSGESIPTAFTTLGSLLSVVAGLVLSVLRSRESGP
jgi:hypothetical protein